jgi:hypothetical protein
MLLLQQFCRPQVVVVVALRAPMAQAAAAVEPQAAQELLDRAQMAVLELELCNIAANLLVINLALPPPVAVERVGLAVAVAPLTVEALGRQRVVRVARDRQAVFQGPLLTMRAAAADR